MSFNSRLEACLLVLEVLSKNILDSDSWDPVIVLLGNVLKLLTAVPDDIFNDIFWFVIEIHQVNSHPVQPELVDILLLVQPLFARVNDVSLRRIHFKEEALMHLLFQLALLLLLDEPVHKPRLQA